MTLPLRPTLAVDVISAASRPRSADHGEQHWKAVAWAGLELAPLVVGCDPELVLLFALFHDSRRFNEFHDPEHGLRGGQLARELCGSAFSIDATRLEVLVDACTRHDRGECSDDPTIAVCWDADRLNLWRVGITPDPKRLCTAQAAGLIESARAYHYESYRWSDLFEAYRQLTSSSSTASG